MTLEEAQKQVDSWIKEYGVRYFSELTNMAILTESGRTRPRHGTQVWRPILQERRKDNLDDEMADVLWVLLCLANQTGVNLTEAFRRNFEKKTRRDQTRHINNPKLKDHGEE